MTARLSLSESLHASHIISQHQEQQLQQQQHDDKLYPGTQKEVGVSFVGRLCLVAAMIGIEATMTFEQIYEILFLQYLGVPAYLLSIPGVITGVVSMSLMPVVGYLSDRGTDPLRRKMKFLFIGLFLFLSGHLLLIISGIIKISDLNKFLHSLNDMQDITTCSNTTEPSLCPKLTKVNASNMPSVDGDFLVNVYNSTSTGPLLPESMYSTTPATAYMGIISFALMDIGYDLSTPLTRAYVLEVVPRFQGTNMLVMSTVSMAMAGVIMSFIGVFDWPEILSPVFHVDGPAATLLLFCGIVLAVVLCSFLTTITSGYVISLRRGREIQNSKNITAGLHTEPPPTQKLGLATEASEREHRDQRLSKVHRPYVPDILHTEHGDLTTRPLILEDSLKMASYSSVMDMSDSPSCGDHGNTHRRGRHSSSSSETYAMTNQGYHSDDLAGGSGESSTDLNETTTAYTHTSTTAKNRHNHLKEPPNQNSTKLRLSKRMIILFIASFFGCGALLSFVMYASNCLTIGIYHGDPTALPGTEGKQLYEKGLRNGAFGNLLLYLMYFLVSINNDKIIRWIGEKLQYVIIHVIVVLSLTTLLVTQSEVIYFITVALFGSYRTCVLTVPFVLANKFVHEEQEKDNCGNGQPSGNKGKVMLLIGFTMPAHFFIMSALVGPLIDATGNVWVPLIYTLTVMVANLLVSSLLFIIK